MPLLTDLFQSCSLRGEPERETGWRIVYAISTLEFQCEKDLKTVEVPVVEPDQTDISTIEGIVKAFYEGISGGKGSPRQWSRDKTLYIPDVRFVSMSQEKGKIHASVMNHNQYVNGSNEFFVQSGFADREISRVVRRFDNLAHVFSVYEYSTEDKKIRGAASTASSFSGTASAGGFRQ